MLSVSISIMENKQATNVKKRDIIISLIFVAAMAALIVILVIDLLPLLKDVAAHADDESVMVGDIRSYGSRGVFVLAALHTLQVLTAVFPSQAIQILAGLCYGVWYGLLICLAGIIAGNVAAFTLSRQLGVTLAPLMARFRSKRPGRQAEKKLVSSSFINRIKHPALLAFILYFIPGLPNGFLPYVFARTKISLWRYLLSIIAASVPSVLLCTVVGERFASGDSATALILIGALVIALALVLIFRKRIMAFIERSSEAAPGQDAADAACTTPDPDRPDGGNDTK